MLFIIIIAFSFYRYEMANITSHRKDRMQNLASYISSQIISSYMHGEELEIKETSRAEVSLYGSRGKLIYGSGVDGVQLKKGFFEQGDFYYLVDTSPRMHHGVRFVVIKSAKVDEAALLRNIALFALFATLAIAAVGYLLSRVFLRPIQSERLKLDKFIKDSTHELNTPITAILMSIERLKKQGIDASVLSRVEISSKRIQKIYSDLTYLLLDDKIEEARELDLATLVRSEVALYEDLASRKDLHFELDLASFNFVIDELSATRLVSNLISNAIKYAKNSSTVELSLQGGVLSIANTTKEKLLGDPQRLFDRYYRSAKGEGGFGLGLDIVRRVCNRYDIQKEIRADGDRFVVELRF